jgi:hypothetical protein
MTFLVMPFDGTKIVCSVAVCIVLLTKYNLIACGCSDDKHDCAVLNHHMLLLTACAYVGGCTCNGQSPRDAVYVVPA